MDEIKYQKAQHIGDGVYVRFDGYHIVLTANVPTTDTIYLDHLTRQALARIVDEIDGSGEPRSESEGD